VLFSSKSVADKGTLCQRKNLLHRTAVPVDPQSNMQAAEGFLETIHEAHIVVTAKAVKKSDSTALSLAEEIVTKFVHLAPNNSARNDEIFTYACETIILRLIWKSYHDSVKEGHWNSILNIWK
jgi:L1 cell adhesion molecule like protein